MNKHSSKAGLKGSSQRPFSLVASLTALSLAAAFAPINIAKANLILDGSFETPGVGSGAYQSYNIGSTIGAWTVVGDGTNPAITQFDTNYTEGPLSFLAQEGNQGIDLTGPGYHGHNGVSQVVATVAGTLYNLSFWVGNQDNAALFYPLASSVELYVDGGFIQLFTNNDNTANALNWKKIDSQFTAAGPTTTIAFYNGTPAGDNMVGLDNVDLEAVPEPGTALFGIACVGVAAMRRRRRA